MTQQTMVSFLSTSFKT